MKILILYCKEIQEHNFKVVDICIVATFKNQLHNYCLRQKSLPTFFLSASLFKSEHFTRTVAQTLSTYNQMVNKQTKKIHPGS